MGRNIVLLSDGTGNSGAKLFKTNVWRLYGALDVSDEDQQVAFYDDGVGTSSFKPLAVLGGVLGFGLKRNVLDLYQFACRNYRPGDKIFGFGFSRGAFTIRVVAGFIAREGLVPYTGNEAQLARDALAAYRRYRNRFNVTGGLVAPLRALRDRLSRAWRRLRGVPQFDPDTQIRPERIHFLGVWDTVAAYGGPIEEVTRGIDYWLWPLSMPDRFMSAKIQRACHALALDDERNAFWPVLWDELAVSGPDGPRPMDESWRPPDTPNLSEIDRQRLSQVWFAGMHSDVGGGYAQDGLSYVTLDWMIDRALVYGLRLKTSERVRIGELADKFDKLNDSRRGMGGYYRYRPRKLADVYGTDPYKPTIGSDLARAARTITGTAEPGRHPGAGSGWGADERPVPIIHESVFQRIAGGLDGYSPIVVPEAYRVTTKTGEIRAGLYEDPSQAQRRAREQEGAWNWVWLRRVVYFTTVFASLFVAAIPWIVERESEAHVPSRAAFLIPAIEAVGLFLPALADPWIESFKAAPGLFAMSAGLVALLLFWGGVLERRIDDVMLEMWRSIVGQPPRPVGPYPPPSNALYRLRMSSLYRGFFYALTHWILPTACAVLMVYGAFVATSRGLFAVADSIGLVCRSGGGAERYDTRALCHPTGVTVTAGQTYEIVLETGGHWWDGDRKRQGSGIAAGPNGFGWDKTTLPMVAGLPLRRHLGEDWFRVIVRVGAVGRDEQALAFEEHPVLGTSTTTYTAKFRAGSGGEVFLFVNDAVIGLPWIGGVFYANNNGEAKVKITRLP